MKLTATKKNGQKVTCEITIDRAGNIKTEYPVIVIWEKRYDPELGAIECGNYAIIVEEEKAILLEQDVYSEILKEAEKIKNAAEWELMLDKNPVLNLAAKNFSVVGAIPDFLKEKYGGLLFETREIWEEDEKWNRTLTISARDLQALIDRLFEEKKEKKEKAEALKKEHTYENLSKKAAATGKRQKLDSYTTETEDKDRYFDLDTTTRYINPDGSISEETDVLTGEENYQKREEIVEKAQEDSILTQIKNHPGIEKYTKWEKGNHSRIYFTVKGEDTSFKGCRNFKLYFDNKNKKLYMEEGKGSQPEEFEKNAWGIFELFENHAEFNYIKN